MAKDLPVTIKLSKNEEVYNGSGETNYHEYTAGSGKTIKVTISEEPSNFYKYTHTLQSGLTFELLKIEDDSGNPIQGILPRGPENVLSVSAYYWKHDKTGPYEKPGNILLVEVTGSDRTAYYTRSSGGNQWVEQNLQPEVLEEKLDDLNCNLNNVVTMDITEDLSGELSRIHVEDDGNNTYCCTYHTKGTGKGKISVTSEKVYCKTHQKTNFIPYFKHSITSGDCRLAGINYYPYIDDQFSGTRNRENVKPVGLDFPIPGPLDAYVFYCDRNPTLIYVKKPGGIKGTNRWYKRENEKSHKWMDAPGDLSGITPENIKNSSHVNFKKLLKAIKNTGGCKDLKECPHSVIIDISQKPPDNGPGPYTYPSGAPDELIKLEKSDNDPPNSSFWKFTHRASSGNLFRITQMKHDTKIFQPSEFQINDYDDIEHLSVWYWKGDDKRKNPLLLEVNKYNGEYKYSKNIGNDTWFEHYRQPPISTSEPLEDEKLEKVLDDLNCSLNNAVTMNIYFSNSESHGSGGQYCCDEHGGDRGEGGMISVKRQEVYCRQEIHRRKNTLTAYYKHSISTTSNLADIKYHDSGSKYKRKRIKLKDYNFPIKGPASVSAFYCSGMNPLLIYVKGNENQKVNKWFKNGKYEQWIEVSTRLQDITPEDLNNTTTSCTYWNTLVDALAEAGCGNYSKCSDIQSLSGTQGDSDRSIGGAKGYTSRSSQPIRGGTGIEYTIGGVNISSTGTYNINGADGSAGITTVTEQGVTAILSAPPVEHPAVPDDANVVSAEDKAKGYSTNPVVSSPGGARGSSGEVTQSNTRDQNFSALFDSLGSIIQKAGKVLGEKTIDLLISSLTDTDKSENHQRTNAVSSNLNAGTASQLEGAKSPTPDGEYQAVVGESVGVTIGYIVSGIFGGSGVAGFAGWKIYKSLKQDPWVRQI